MITVSNVSLRRGDKLLLKDANFSAYSGHRVGLTGANGAGKSTLIKAIAGELKAQQGSIDRSKEINIGYFGQYQLDQLRPDDTPLSHLRRVNTPIDKSGKLIPPRKLHSSHWGYVCPSETPEGPVSYTHLTLPTNREV